MVKLLLVVCVISSSIFMLTQLITFYFFDEFDVDVDDDAEFDDVVNMVDTPNRTLLRSITTVQTVFHKFNLSLTLVDVDILQPFLEAEVQHRTLGTHDHNGCDILCGRTIATFMVDGEELTRLSKQLISAFREQNYLITIGENYDQREISLERKRGVNKKMFNLFLENRGTLVHIVGSYHRRKLIWNSYCSMELLTPKWRSQLSQKEFCKREHVLNPIESTEASMDGIKVRVPLYLRAFLNELRDSTFLQCNYQQARLFYSSYGYDSSPDSELFRSKAVELLTKVSEILTLLQVPFWLSSGTCLGWFRQCDLIPHSKDVDIGIRIKDYNGRIIDTFEQQGFKLKHLFGKVEDSFELSFLRGDMKLDIFFFYEEEDYVWNGGTQVKSGKKFKYKFSPFNLCWTDFKGFFVRVPCETRSYILANYGKHWNQLVKEWDWKKSPPNVRENGEWPEEERAAVIKTFD